MNSSEETTNLILQTLLTIVSQPEGASEFMTIQDLSPLIEIACQHPLVLQVFLYSWTNASTIVTETEAVKKSIDSTIPALIVNFKGTDAVTLLSFVANLLPKLESEVSLQHCQCRAHADCKQALPRNSKWLAPLTALLRNLVSSKPTAAGRAAYTELAAALLQAYPVTSPYLLFKDGPTKDADTKPFSYLLVNLLLIDIRASMPSLLAKLNSTEYPAISQRLAAAFDVVSSFIGYLVRSLDDESTAGFSMTPDLLLKLRKDIAETMSLAIEYLRDRWDASIAGASGLHPDARSGTAATSEGTRLTLTWESMRDDVTADPLILAGIRTLAIWIREDENENLRNETAGLMDMLVELYKASSIKSVDFRYPILLALEGIMVTEEGVDSFLAQEGWQVIFSDLQAIVRNTSEHSTSPGHQAEAGRGLQIVRVLLAIIDHEATSFPREDWMTAVTTTAGIKVSSTTSPPSVVLELQIAVLQLSAALLSKSAGGMTKRYVTSLPALSGLLSKLRVLVKAMDNRAESIEFIGLLDDVALDLGNLKHN